MITVMIHLMKTNSNWDLSANIGKFSYVPRIGEKITLRGFLSKDLLKKLEEEFDADESFEIQDVIWEKDEKGIFIVLYL